MANLLDLIPPVSMLAPGAPEPVVAHTYVDSAREFLRRTLAWRADVEILEPGPLHGMYLLDLPAGSEVVDGIHVQWRDGEKGLVKRTKLQMDRLSSRTGTRPEMYRVTPGALFVAPNPEGIDLSAELSRITVALYPRRSTHEIDDEIVDRFAEIIERGALYRLLMMPGKAWADTSAAAAYLTAFREDVDEWRSRAADDGMTGVARKVRYGGL